MLATVLPVAVFMLILYRLWSVYTCLDIRNCILIYDDKDIYEDVLQSLVTFYHLPSSSQLVRYFIIRCRSFGAPKARKTRNRII